MRYRFKAVEIVYCLVRYKIEWVFFFKYKKNLRVYLLQFCVILTPDIIKKIRPFNFKTKNYY